MTLLVILLILILVGAIPTRGYGQGPYAIGPLGVILIVVIVLLLTGRI